MGLDNNGASGDVEAATRVTASSEKDDAIAMVGEQTHAIDPVVEARAKRKIDWFLIPAMVLGCM